MTAEEYINFKKEDFKYNCIEAMVAYSEEEANACFELISTYIERLKAVRASEKLTEKVVKEIIEEASTTIYGFSSGTKRELYLSWLVKALWVDSSYYWSKILLGTYQNHGIGNSRHDLRGLTMSDLELFDLLKAEDDSKRIAISNATTIKVDNSVLLNLLSKYISGIDEVEFNYIIAHHTLKPGTPKVSWNGTKADAHRFASFTKFKLPDFNKCFSFPNGSILKHNDKDKLSKSSLITDILKAHFNK